MSKLDDKDLEAHLSRRRTATPLDHVARAEMVESIHARTRRASRDQGWLHWRWVAGAATALAVVLLVTLALPHQAPAPGPQPTASATSDVTGSPVPTVDPGFSAVLSPSQLVALVEAGQSTGRIVLANVRLKSMKFVPTGVESPAPETPVGGYACRDETTQFCLIARVLDVEPGRLDVYADLTRFGPDASALAIDPINPRVVALRIADDSVEYLGNVAQPVGDAWTVADTMATPSFARGDVYPVAGWLTQTPPPRCRGPADSTSPVEYWCGGSWISDEPVAVTSADGSAVGLVVANALHVQWDAYREFAEDPQVGANGGEPRQGTYLVQSVGCPPNVMGNCPVWELLGRVEPPTTALESPRPVATESSRPSPSPLPTLAPTPTTLSAGDAATLATGAWVNASMTTDEQGDPTSFDLDFGRLDGRRFHFSAPSLIDATRPANNGTVIAWWWDAGATESIVVLIDTATGSMTEFARLPTEIYAAGLSPQGDAWYWVPSSDPPKQHGEPARPDANGLWQQELPQGERRKVADWPGYASAVEPSADGSQVLLVDPEPATDYGPVHYHVWYAGSGRLFDLPVTEESSYGLFDRAVLLDSYRDGLVAVDPRTHTSAALRIDDRRSIAEVDLAQDGSERLVFLAPGPDGDLTIFQLLPGATEAVRLYESGYPPDSDPLSSQRLVGGLAWGRISMLGWVPWVAYGSEYTFGRSAAEAQGIPSQVVNLADGAVLTLPPLSEAIEVTPG